MLRRDDLVTSSYEERLRSSQLTKPRANVLFDEPVTVVEPSSTPAPSQQRSSVSRSTTVESHQLNHDFEKLSLSFHAGRSSAPPQMMDTHSKGFSSDRIFHQHRIFGSTQLRDIESKATNNTGHELQSRTPIPSFANNPSKFGMKLTATSTPPDDGASLDNSALVELDSHVWEPSKDSSHTDFPSRALAIFGVSQLPLTEVKSTCEAFGSLLYFRSEFCEYKDVLLVAYHDLRCTRHAANELDVYLQRLASGGTGIHLSPNTNRIKVLYCVSLSTSSDRDESTLVLSNLPPSVIDRDITEMVSSTRGSIRSVQYNASERSDSFKTYTIEFFDLQDAAHALLELESTKPWGAHVTVTAKVRQQHERKRGQEMFTIMQRWRQDMALSRNDISRSVTPAAPVPSTISTHQQFVEHSSPEISISSGGFARTSSSGTGSSINTNTQHLAMQYARTTQLLMDQNGQYSYVVVPGVPESGYGPMIPPGHYLPGVDATPRGYFPYWSQPHGHTPVYHSGSGHVMHHPGYDFNRSNQEYHLGQETVQYHSNLPIPNGPGYMFSDGTMSAPSQGEQSRRGSSISPKKTDDVNDSLILAIEAVKKAQDKRTSLMIRNIPNKYTQSMLLNEFKESGHGPGKIDFFYLPIDFRNKCNRGYAFINFNDYKDIISFYEQYNGKRWNIFKSEKICCVTYARIQGKDSMMKRFQNSSLMERNEDYRPLVFAENGTQIEHEIQ
jgi:RNA recognition motif-containing protein